MLNEKQLMAINLLIDGKLSKVDIAKTCGKSRQWLYDSVLNFEEAKVEWGRQLQIIQTEGINTIKSNLTQSILNIVTLANTSDDEKLRLTANMWIVDHSIGKATTKIELNEKQTIDEVSESELELDFNKFKAISVDVDTQE